MTHGYYIMEIGFTNWNSNSFQFFLTGLFWGVCVCVFFFSSPPDAAFDPNNNKGRDESERLLGASASRWLFPGFVSWIRAGRRELVGPQVTEVIPHFGTFTRPFLRCIFHTRDTRQPPGLTHSRPQVISFQSDSPQWPCLNSGRCVN